MLPRGWDRRTTVFLTFVLLVPSGTADARAQVFDLERDRVQMVPLDGLWRFHPGDDPKWADPDFDDSSWPLIRSDKSWSEQGYKDMSGTAWYRVKVNIPENESQLSLYIPLVYTSYQVFSDGKFVGGLGGMPPHESTYLFARAVYALPPHSPKNGRSVSIAIRVWHWPKRAKVYGGGLQGGIWIGQTSRIQQMGVSRDHETAWSSVGDLFVAILESLAGLAALALFVLRPREKEYLSFGVMLLLYAGWNSYYYYPNFHSISLGESSAVEILLETGYELASIAFFFRLLRGTRNWVFWTAVGSIPANLIGLVPGVLGLISRGQWSALDSIQSIPITVWILTLLIQRAIEGLPDARLLLAPVLVKQLVWITYVTLTAAGSRGLYAKSASWLDSTWQQPFPFSIFNLTDLMFLIAMLAILIYRFALSRQKEERFANEFQAARSVQQVLIPEAVPTIPGFKIQSIFLPFGEVGGDLFQILPTPNGGALIVIGDVSGKGMPAAMAVSLLVGTARTLAHYTQSPTEILTAMNQRMIGRSKDGFTTCLVLRIDPDGAAAFANAGHLAPYLDTRELPVDSGLPLGLSAEAVYPESSFHLDEGQEVTILTDGVAEARSKTGELFGFERTASISILSAEQIAATAAAFGQQDDITVLKIRRCAVPAPAGHPLTAAPFHFRRLK